MNQADRILSVDSDEVMESILASTEGEDIETPVISRMEQKWAIGNPIEGKYV